MEQKLNRGFEWIHQLKRERHCNITDLLALSRQNDPYFSGSPADQDRAHWFAQIWRKLGYTDQTTGIHLRRLHYAIGSRQLRKLDGKPYSFSDKADWPFLLDCSRHARYLGFIRPDQLVDRRNGEPVYLAHFDSPSSGEPYLIKSSIFWPLPQMRVNAVLRYQKIRLSQLLAADKKLRTTFPCLPHCLSLAGSWRQSPNGASFFPQRKFGQSVRFSLVGLS